MVDFDSVTINEEERDRDPIAHPRRTDGSQQETQEKGDLEVALEQMSAVEDEDFESEVLALRNNLDEFVRRRVDNHNTHIGLMNNPTVNEVEIDGEEYQVVGERFFEMNQFPEFGDAGEIRWTALVPQEQSWGMETPPNRGEHAVGGGRNIEACSVSLDGEPLNSGEVEALSQDVRISQETEQDFTLDAPRIIAEYDSLAEAVESEDITRGEFEGELRSAQHRGMVTEDLNITLKGWMSFIDTNARGIAALEQLDESQGTVDLGGFRPSYLPPFGSLEGAVTSSGRLTSAIFSNGDGLFATGSDAEVDYAEGVLDVENDDYREELEAIMGDLESVNLHDQPVRRAGLRDALQVFIEGYDGGEAISVREEVDRGNDEEDYIHELIDEELASIGESELEDITISPHEGLEQALQEMGYSVEEVEQCLEEASQGLTAAEDVSLISAIEDYSLNFEGLDDPLYGMFATEIESLNRTQINPDENRGMATSAITAANVMLVEYLDELETHGFDWERVQTYGPNGDNEFFGADIEAQFEEEGGDLWGDVDYYGREDIYQEGNIRNPKEMSQEVRGLLRAMEDEDIIQIDQNRIPDTVKLQVDTSNDHYEHLQEELPDSGESFENGEATYEVGPGENQADSVLLTIMQDNEAVENYEIDETQQWELEYNREAMAMFEYEIDASIDSVRIADEPVVLASLYATEEMEYESNEGLERASEAMRPFNGENIPYDSDRATFETEFQLD